MFSFDRQQSQEAGCIDFLFKPVQSEELTALYQAAKAVYVLDIQPQTNCLKQLDPKYAVFADRVLKLAEEFDDRAIVNLVKPPLANGR